MEQRIKIIMIFTIELYVVMMILLLLFNRSEILSILSVLSKIIDWFAKKQIIPLF